MKSVYLNKIEKDIEALDTIIDNTLEKNNISFSALMTMLKKRRKEPKELAVPSSILKDRRLGVLESIVKYLKENLSLSLTEIGKALNRNPRLIWISYDNAKRKIPKPFTPKKEDILLPINILSNRKLGCLENICTYLKEDCNLKFSQIAKLLNRDSRSIWISYHKAVEKNDSK